MFRRREDDLKLIFQTGTKQATLADFPPPLEDLEDEDDIGDCDICGQTKPVTQLGQCEICLLIICDNCRKTHNHNSED